MLRIELTIPLRNQIVFSQEMTIDLVDRLEEELQNAQLQYYGMKRSGDTLYLLYNDSRIDIDRLSPIFDKYHSQFIITYKGPVYERSLQGSGFTKEGIGQLQWEEVLLDGELITIIPKG